MRKVMENIAIKYVAVRIGLAERIIIQLRIAKNMLHIHTNVSMQTEILQHQKSRIDIRLFSVKRGFAIFLMCASRARVYIILFNYLYYLII